MAVDMGIDYEGYAARPNFHGAVRHPEIFFRAIGGASGLYDDVGAGDGSRLRGVLDIGALRNFSAIRAFDISQERVSRIQRSSLRLSRKLQMRYACPRPMGPWTSIIPIK